MSIYDRREVQGLFAYSTSTQKQIDLLYQMYHEVKHNLDRLECHLSNYDNYRNMVLCHEKDISDLKDKYKTLVTTINQVIDSVKCTNADFDKRITALEQKALIANAESI